MSETFLQELAELLNRHSMENDSDTPDFILAQFILGCLASFNASVQQREIWYDRDSWSSKKNIEEKQ